MSERLLFILVEGPDDERFIRYLLESLLTGQHHQVNIVKYAHKTQKEVNRLIISIGKMAAEYFLLTDLDHSPCITQRRQKTKAKYSYCNESSLQVVIQEIESWYLAGLDEEKSRKLKLSHFESTNHITKEQFNKMVSPKTSRRDFMIEILKLFSIPIARQKNDSFRYFLEKLSLFSGS